VYIAQKIDDMKPQINKKAWNKPEIKILSVKNFTLSGAKTTQNENPKQTDFIPS
jgi:hypothetical protein